MIEIEDLIKIIYKLEIMANYDSPDNSKKSIFIRNFGCKVIDKISHLCLY